MYIVNVFNIVYKPKKPKTKKTIKVKSINEQPFLTKIIIYI